MRAPRPRQIPSIHTLHLDGFSGTTFKNLLARLIFPNLKHLLVQHGMLYDEFHNCFPVGPSLISLSLRNTTLDKEAFDGAMEAFCELETLDLGLRRVEAGMLEGIGPDPERVVEGYPLPRPSALTLGRSAASNQTGLTTMAQPRKSERAKAHSTS